MKKVLVGLGVLVVLGVIAVGGGAWWLANNVDRLVKNAIEDYGSQMVGAKVSVQSVELRASGEGLVKGLFIGNPKGFATPHAARLDQFDVAIDLPSLTGDVIHVQRINIVTPDLIYERGDALTNFDAIQRNINTYIGPSKGQARGNKKLIVDLLTIRHAKARASAAFMSGKTVEVSLPDVTLRDIGKAKGGVTPAELGQIVAGAMEKQLSAKVSFDNLRKQFGSAIESGVKSIKGLFK
jgi:hypothetical protein